MSQSPLIDDDTANEIANDPPSPGLNRQSSSASSSERVYIDTLPRLSNTSSRHHDLTSFLAYAEATQLDKKSTVYKGTHYEYTVVEVLKPLGFNLRRVGKANDFGVDLVGYWMIPSGTKLPSGNSEESLRQIPVLVQCKASKPVPAFVRELEGIHSGAPAGWRDENAVIALLAADGYAPKGVRDGIQRSKCPIGSLQITCEGDVQQFLWNTSAASCGIEGVGVTVRFWNQTVSGAKGSTLSQKSGIALTWMGKAWRTSGM